MSIHPSIVETIAMIWQTEADAAAFAQNFARQHDLQNTIIELRGDLGVGKTTFARHLLQALGVTGRIKSPSYAIVETYEVQDVAKTLTISHFDFYRFKDPNEWEEAGFRDIFAAQGLKIVEWAEKAHPMLPKPNWVIDISMQQGDSRQVILSDQKSK
jgi:tRNA threonylcarbamoyladenosine biosynthesis protein TsaE